MAPEKCLPIPVGEILNCFEDMGIYYVLCCIHPWINISQRVLEEKDINFPKRLPAQLKTRVCQNCLSVEKQ